MAISKVILDGSTLLDVTNSTVNAQRILSGYVAKGADGVDVTGAYAPPTFDTQAKSATPSESQQTVTPDSGYDGLSSVTVGAVSSTYVGSGITRRSSTDLTASGATVTVPSGYYQSQASKAVSSGTAGTPTATKGTVSSHSVSVTPSVTNTAGYITGGTVSGTAVTVSASELVSGSQTITENGTVDVTNLASVDVEVESSGGNHKVTVSASSASVNCRVKLNGAGTSYYKNGAEFEFAAGDYIQAYAMGSQGGGEIYVNGVRVAGGQDGATFNYALPPCNVAVSTAYSTTGRVYITTEEPIVVFENGEFTPSEDVTEVSVSFANSHMQPPTIVMVGDVQNSTSSTSTVENFVFIDEYRLFGNAGRFGTSTTAQGVAGGMYSSSTTALSSRWNRIVYGSANASATDSTYSRWWASTTGFRAFLSSSECFRAGRKYAWTAIWTS